MLRFYAASFVASVSELHRSIVAIHTFGYDAAMHLAEDRKAVSSALGSLKLSLSEMPASPLIRGQLDELINAVPQSDGRELSIMARAFSNNLIRDLQSSYFLMIPTSARKFYEQRGCPFGEQVATAFPDATADISAASRCLALDEWTACVFHLMRVLEHGLNGLAKIAGLPPESMALENWKNVIDQIEKKIRAMEAEPKSPQKIVRIRELSSAASQFRYFKDAWRNHVAHSHSWHNSASGTPVWTHVRDFMQQMAALSSLPEGRP